MTIELNGSSLRVSAGYSTKIPHEVDYAMNEAHVGLSIEATVTDVEELEEIEAQAIEIQQQLHTTAKLAVFAQLGLEYETTPSGVLVPQIEAPKRAKKSSGGSRKSSSNGSGGGGFTKPKANLSELDQIELPWGTYYDCRPLKEDGTYKSGAADFRAVEFDDVEGGYQQLWLYNKDGSPNGEVVKAVEAVEPFE